MIDLQNLYTIYNELLSQIHFEEKNLDYGIVKNHKSILQTLSVVGNNSISVFDFYKKEHIFYSANYGENLGYKLTQIEKEGQEFFDSKIHPDDHLALVEKGVSILKLFINFSLNDKLNHKLINEYRILNSQNTYVRMIEQHQVLELDNKGNPWLTLSTIDISPNQEGYNDIKSQLLNFKTGKIIQLNNDSQPIKTQLSNREREILQLVKNGLLSKEISDKLSISVHTVNTHRQRFLEKLGANNSMEAVIFASKLGLLD